MKILFFSDLHVHNIHRFSYITPNGRTVRENEHLDCARVVSDLIKKENIDRVVFGGDAIATVGDSLSTQCLDTLCEFFKIIQKTCIERNIEFDILVGNHDLSSNTNTLSTHKLKAFSEWSNINVYDTPTISDNHVYMPYCSNDETAESFLNNIPDKQNKIVFSHLELNNVNLGADIYSKKGVNIELLQQFKMTLQGHYHSLQTIAKNIIVSGSTQCLSFKDRGSARNNIIIYDTETNKYKRESFNCPQWLTFTDDNIDELLSIDDNNYVLLKLASDLLLTPEIKNKLETVKGKEVMIEINRISTNRHIQDNLTNADTLQILKTIIERTDYSDDDKQAIFEEGKRLIEKVQK